MKIYLYSPCSTCQKTLKILKEKNIQATLLDIRQTPPSFEELKIMRKSVESLKKMMNTHSQDYRVIKKQLETMEEEEILQLMSHHGNIIKRPFILAGEKNWVGHQPEMLECFSVETKNEIKK